MFDQVDVGEWFLLIYNDGDSLENLNVDITLQGNLNDMKFCGVISCVFQRRHIFL